VKIRTTVTFISSITAIIVSITDHVRRQTVAFHWTTEVVVQTVCTHKNKKITIFIAMQPVKVEIVLQDKYTTLQNTK